MKHGTTITGGLTAGAARLRICPPTHLVVGTAASIHASPWLGETPHMPVAKVLATDRPTRRLAERMP